MNIYHITVRLLNQFPYNYFTLRIIHKVANRMSDESEKTHHGYLIDLKRTGAFATYLRKSIISSSYERTYLGIIWKLANPDDYVVDVGAHEGYVCYTLNKKI